MNMPFNKFELNASMIPRQLEALYLGYFMNGLKEEIKNWVRLLGLDSRLSAITLDQNAEVALGQKGGFESHSIYEGDEGETGYVHVNSQFKQVDKEMSPLS